MLLLETEAKWEAILFLFGCPEVNSTLLITSVLTNQNAQKYYSLMSYIINSIHNIWVVHKGRC